MALPRERPSGGTLFERMSNIARGAPKAQIEEDGDRIIARTDRHSRASSTARTTNKRLANVQERAAFGPPFLWNLADIEPFYRHLAALTHGSP